MLITLSSNTVKYFSSLYVYAVYGYDGGGDDSDDRKIEGSNFSSSVDYCCVLGQDTPPNTCENVMRE